MARKIQNIVVVGKSDVSTAILHSLSHATSPSTNNKHYPNHHSNSNGICHNHNDNRSHGQNSPYKLHLLTRTHQTPPPFPNVQHQTSDFTLGSLTATLQAQDAVISTTSPADIPFQKRLIDAAIAAHVSYFMPCEFSYDTQSAAVRDAYPPCEARNEVIESLRVKGKESGLRWVGIAIGAMLENGLSEGLRGFDLMWKSATIYGTGEGRFAAGSLDWIGETVVGVIEVLQKDEGVGLEEYIYRPEFVTSQNDILAALEETEGMKWDVIKADVEECVREAERRMEKGFFDGAMMLMERNLLFGHMGNVAVWESGGSGVKRDRRLWEIVRGVIERLKRDGRGDCGCG